MLFLFFGLLIGITIASPNPPLAGGWTVQNPSDQEYSDLAWKTATSAVNNDASNANSNYALVPVKVISAQTQVVAGMNYKLEIEFGQSSCAKNSAELTAANCPVSANAPTKIYSVKIFSQPWTQTLEVTNIQEVTKTY